MRSVLPQAVRDLTAELNRLPGVGPKTASRLALHLLRQPKASVRQFAETLETLHENVRMCGTCFNLADQEKCIICRDSGRDTSLVCVVEEPLDIEAIERTNSFSGVYHVLGGVLSPLEGIGVDSLQLESLFARITGSDIRELIIGLDPTLEGEATARYIRENMPSGTRIKISRFARGIPTGGDVEFADAMTLSAALHGRKEL